MTPEEYKELKTRSAPDGTEYAKIIPFDRQALFETIFVVEDESGQRIASALALRVPEMILVMEPNSHPTVKQAAIAVIHQEMRGRLRARGYYQAFAVVPPMLQGYVRRMKKIFGWKRDYPCYRVE